MRRPGGRGVQRRRHRGVALVLAQGEAVTRSTAFSGVEVRNEAPQGVPPVSVSDARAAEGEAVEFRMSLSAASGEEVTVGYATSGGTAESEADFTAASGDADVRGERHVSDCAGGDGGRLGGRGERDPSR